MKVFKDAFSGDEMFSDSFPHVKVYGDSMWEVKSKYVPKDDNVVIHEKGAFDADEPEDTGDIEMVNNMIENFKLNEVVMTKKDFMGMIKPYLKRGAGWLKEKNPERVKGFMSGATEAVKFIGGRFDEFQIYAGNSYDMECGCAFAYQKEQCDEAPTFLFFADCMIEQKF